MLDFVYCNENRNREGELDGNTVYWEYKKGNHADSRGVAFLLLF